MPRLMAVSLTEEQVRARSKTVTRRTGWLMLKPGDRLTLCKKVMGRCPGEPLDRITDVQVTGVRRERLDAVTAADVAAEGFPGKTPAEFVKFFCDSHKGCTPASLVTRVQWRYLLGRWTLNTDSTRYGVAGWHLDDGPIALDWMPACDKGCEPGAPGPGHCDCCWSLFGWPGRIEAEPVDRDLLTAMAQIEDEWAHADWARLEVSRGST